MRGLLLAAMIFGLVGCRTIHVWDLGFPVADKSLSDAGREAAFKKFSLVRITKDSVVVAVMEDYKPVEREYSRESFEPIFRHVTPSVSDSLAEADESESYRLLFFSGYSALMMQAAPVGASLESVRSAILMVGSLGSYWGGSIVTANYAVAREAYQDQLKKFLETGAAGR